MGWLDSGRDSRIRVHIKLAAAELVAAVEGGLADRVKLIMDVGVDKNVTDVVCRFARPNSLSPMPAPGVIFFLTRASRVPFTC